MVTYRLNDMDFQHLILVSTWWNQTLRNFDLDLNLWIPVWANSTTSMEFPQGQEPGRDFFQFTAHEI